MNPKPNCFGIKTDKGNRQRLNLTHECTQRTLDDCKRLCLARDVAASCQHGKPSSSPTPLASTTTHTPCGSPSATPTATPTGTPSKAPAASSGGGGGRSKYGLLQRKQKQKAERKESARDKQAQRELRESGMTHHWVDLVKDLDGSHFQDGASGLGLAEGERDDAPLGGLVKDRPRADN